MNECREYISKLLVLLVCLNAAVNANAGDLWMGSSNGYAEPEELQMTQGDVNGDGHVSIEDVAVLIDVLLDDGSVTDLADVNGDGHVSIYDVAILIDLLLGNASSGDPEEPTVLEAPSILILGNSFTLDSWSYVPFLLKDYGINIKLGIYYLAGGSLTATKNGYTKGAPNASYNRGFYYIDTSTDTAWSLVIPKSVMSLNGIDYYCPTPQQCVQYYVGMENELASVMADSIGTYDAMTGKMWDIIVLQQVSTGSVLWTSYYDNSTSIHHAKAIKNLIDSDMKHEYSLGWNLIHSKSGADTDLPTDIIANIHDACSQDDSETTARIDVVFPYGTAIYNARNDTTLKSLGYNGNTDLWHDGQHLTGGLPHYLASIAIVEKILRQFFPDLGLSVQGNSVIPDADWVRGKNMLSGRATTIVGATAENCALAQMAAIRACDDPWNIYGGWPLTVRIKCNDNCYIYSAPAEYGIESGARDVSFQVPKGKAITDIVIRTNDGYELYDKTANNQAYYRHMRRDGVSAHYAGINESLGTEFIASIPGDEVTCNIEMFFNAKTR